MKVIKHPKTAAATELNQAMQSCRRAVGYAFLFSFCMNVLMLLLPIYSLQVLDRVISSRSYDTLIVLSLITIIGFSFYGIFNMIRQFVFSGICEWLDAKLAPRLLSMAVVKSSMSVHTNAGQYQRDLNSIKGFIMNGLGILLDAPWSLLFIIVIYMINPILGFLAVIGSIMLVLFALINEYATKKPLEKAQENSIQSMQIADIASRNAEAVEAMGMMPNVLNNWVEHNNKGLEQSYKGASRANIIQSVSRSLRMIIQIGVIGIGATLALENELTVGAMIACSILVGRALGPFEGAIGVWKGLIQAREAYHRLDMSLTTTPNLRGTMELPAPKGDLVAEGLYYTPPGSAPIIKNVNFALKAGESLGIIGPSAAGKSTLAKVIIGILPPSHGALRLDGVETFKWNREDFGQYVGYMPQHVDLFNGTIKDNIARMNMQANDADVIHAAKLAGCHEMILRLPNGYETQFSQGNLSLSPGQRQRIGLARALYGNPRFIVLDEPNGNLDGEGERALIRALANIKKMGITYIVVAHRPSIVSGVDKIMTLRSGSIEAFGAREEVLKQYTGGAKPAKAAGE
ncbi:MAG: type I secretion system permease/ATPase [Rickettsiales bacterium]|nr:type I secretion system permease/ATPase [Rickettsiales bacterium]